MSASSLSPLCHLCTPNLLPTLLGFNARVLLTHSACSLICACSLPLGSRGQALEAVGVAARREGGGGCRRRRGWGWPPPRWTAAAPPRPPRGGTRRSNSRRRRSCSTTSRSSGLCPTSSPAASPAQSARPAPPRSHALPSSSRCVWTPKGGRSCFCSSARQAAQMLRVRPRV